MISIENDQCPTIDFRMPDGTTKPIVIRGPAALEFNRLGAVAFKDGEENDKGMVEAVDALLAVDHGDLVGQLSLKVYVRLFREAHEKIQTEIAAAMGDLEKKA